MLQDYSHLTEVAGSKVSREQLERMYSTTVMRLRLHSAKARIPLKWHAALVRDSA